MPLCLTSGIWAKSSGHSWGLKNAAPGASDAVVWSAKMLLRRVEDRLDMPLHFNLAPGLENHPIT